MRIALVHDYLKEIGGAEKVLEVLSDLFPEAPIYTSLYFPKNFGPHQSRLEKKWSHRIHTSFFQKLPFAEKLISPLRILSPYAFKFFNLKNFDLIITSATGAYFPNALNKHSAKLICYCHTPPRYLYGYPTARKITNPVLLTLSDIANHFLRLADFTFAQNVDQFIANSHEVEKRIQKFYKRSSVVIYPPIDIPPLNQKHVSPKSNSTTRSFYLTGGRLARAKKFDIAIQACIKLNLPLKIFGRDFAGYAEELKTLAKNHPHIEFLGEVSQEEKNTLYQSAIAYLNPAVDEDFGMTAPEAMSYGCPVIAHNSGGPAESVVNGHTGILYNDPGVNGLIKAVESFNQISFTRQDIIHHSLQYSTENFNNQISKLVLQSSLSK